MKRGLFFLIILMVLPAVVYGGFHFGMVDAVKKKIKKLDEKVAEKREVAEKNAVKQLYEALESSVEREDITAFVSYFSDDYSHQQATKEDWREHYSSVFEISTNIQVSITDIKMTIEDNLATTSFHLKIASEGVGVWIDEDILANPYGAWNYLIKENGQWKFYGDHAQRSYYVYGGNTPLSSAQAMNPEIYGYTLLGSARPLESKTFYGSYNFFEVLVYWKNAIKIDALQKSDGSYYSGTFLALSVWDLGNLFGAPDGLYASVSMVDTVMFIGGVVVSSDGSDSIRVIVVP